MSKLLRPIIFQTQACSMSYATLFLKILLSVTSALCHLHFLSRNTFLRKHLVFSQFSCHDLVQFYQLKLSKLTYIYWVFSKKYNVSVDGFIANFSFCHYVHSSCAFFLDSVVNFFCFYPISLFYLSRFLCNRIPWFSFFPGGLVILHF